MLSPLRLQRYMKGVSSHRRISILLLLDKSPGLPLQDIAERAKCNFKTTAEHVRRLVSAGLVSKGRNNGSVPHRLTPRGKKVLSFLSKLE